MSDQSANKNDMSDEPEEVSASSPNREVPTKRIHSSESPSPDATVTIKVAPDQHLFIADESRQATAPMRHPAMHIRPIHDIGGEDAHRTPTQLRRTAHFQDLVANSSATAQLRNDTVEAAAREDAGGQTDEAVDAPATETATDEELAEDEAGGQESAPEDEGTDTVHLDDSMNTAIMDVNSKTLVETGWRCPECKAPNRHQGAGKNPAVECKTCGYQTNLTAALVAPLENKAPAQEASLSMNLVKGKTLLGKYMLDRFLGRGGMGEVWLGRHPNLDIPVAIKIMSTDLMARNPTYLERFLSEARTAAQMNHPNVVRIYDADHHNGMYFIVLEYMNGGDVLQWARKEGGKLKPRDAINVVIAVAEALEEAARFNIIHRDIKPENIMLANEGGIKLADLGIAKRIVGAEEAEHFTFTAMILGTPAYISPEQALNASDVDIRADIYSLGATFYHLVTGSIPFPAKSPFQMMYKHVKEPLVNPRERNPELGENYSAVICKMMEKDPLDRYPDTESLLTDLYRIRDRDASVMQLQASQLPESRGALGETHVALSEILAESAPQPQPEKSSIWKMAPVQLAIGAAIASLAVILGVQMAPPPAKPEDGMTMQLRNALLQVRRHQKTLQSQPVEDPASGNGARSQPEVVGTAGGEGSRADGEAPQPVEDGEDGGSERPPVGDDGNQGATADAVASSVAEVARMEKQQELLNLRRERFGKRLQEVKTAWEGVRDAGHAPSHGVEAAILQAEQMLADAQVAAAGRQWDVAAAHLDKALGLSLNAKTIAADRQRASSAMTALLAARKGAVAAGASEVEGVAVRWGKAENEFAALRAGFDNAAFREVILQAPELTRDYQHLEVQAPAIRDRETVAATFRAAYEAADRQLLETWASDELAAIEKARRLAAAETIRHDDAAAGFRRATKLLKEAVALAAARRGEAVRAEKAEAAAAAKMAAAKAAAAKWQEVRTELEQLSDQAVAAAAEPRTTAVAVLTGKMLQRRLGEAKEHARNDEDRAFLKAADERTAALISRLSAVPKSGHGWLIPELELEMLPIAAGRYQRGSDTGAEDERPQHPVIISKPYWIGKYEITQRQFRVVAGNNPASLRETSDLPVESVTWEQAMSFCRVLNEREGKAGRLPTGYEYRLPTEAEWEYACRAGTTTKFSFGDDRGLMANYGNYCDRSFSGNSAWRDVDHDDRYGKTAPVGRYKPNAWGLHDMHGNVAEWCLDRYARYPKSEVTDPIGGGRREERIFRGGNWTGAATLCRSAQRSAAASNYTSNSLGFRIVLGPSLILGGGGGTLLNP